MTVLCVAAAAVRLPLFAHFNLVSFDGTYYINQARALWSGVSMPGQFPLGYPFFVSLLLPFFRDGVTAAQVVSLVAGLGSVVTMFFLARAFVSRRLAFYAALVLALTPLCIRLSLETFSESTFTCLMLVALLLYARGRDFPAGLAAGAAAATRPEMVAVAGLMTLARGRAPRRAAVLLGGFLLLYATNAVVLSRTTGHVTLLQKTEFLGTRAQSWVEREESAAEMTEKESAAKRPGAGEIATSFVDKFPHEIYSLARNTAFLIFLLAILGAVQRPSFLLFAMVPILSIPLFTVRSLPRYLLPYVPIVVLYAFVGVERLPRPRWRTIALAAIALAVVAGPLVNLDLMRAPVDEGMTELKTAGLAMRPLVHPGDLMADRKPYVAFYSGADYVEIPLDGYEATMDYLLRENVRFLSLYYPVIDAVRPVLSPLLTDEAMILGELRFKQVYTHEKGLIVYERTGTPDPLRWSRVTPADVGPVSSPAWTPDMKKIAFVTRGEHESAIVWEPADGRARSAPPQVLVDGPGNNDHPAWSHDGTRLAFASTRSGNWDIYVLTLATGKVVQVTSGPEADGAPCWLPGDRELLYVSKREKQQELRKLNLQSRRSEALAGTGGANYPAVSPSGARVAWVVPGRGVAVLNVADGSVHVAAAPREAQYRPAWSADERYLAVTAKNGTNVTVYLLTADGRRCLVLTKNAQANRRSWFDGQPAWSRDGKRLALVSNHEGFFGVYVLEGLGPYCERLSNPPRIASFDVTNPPK